MSTTGTCPDCGSPLPADAPQGLCPQCLARAAMKTQSPTVGSPLLDKTITIDPAAVLEVSPTIRYFGDYELIQEIARGGMGVVYKARQKSLNRIVAVKMILSGQLAGEVEVKRFRTEAEAAANLQHPNIVAIHEVGEHEGRHYFSMDYVEGKNLADHCAGKPLSANQAAALVRTMAEAVQYAHQRGILHRDLKPQNVMLDERGQPRLTDFGLAKKVDQDSSLTATGEVMGSPAYMPPEQAAGRTALLGPASDVYALGAILYQLLTGKPPFSGEHPMVVMQKVLTEEPAAPSKLNAQTPVDLETICLKCLEKQPERRYASARDIAEELGRFLNHEPILTRPASRTRKTWNWFQRHPWTVAGILTALILAVVSLSYGLWQKLAYANWTAAHPGEVPQSGLDWLAMTFFPMGFLLVGLYGTALMRFSRTYRRQKLTGVPIASSLLARHGTLGLFTLVYGLALVLRGVELQVWHGDWISIGMMLFSGPLLCCVGAESLWTVIGLLQGSLFESEVDRALERAE